MDIFATEYGTIYIDNISNDIDFLESSIVLTSEENNYYSLISSIKRKCEWLSSRILLRRILGDNVSTIYNLGRPELVGDSKHISISHTRDFVAVLVSDHICGIDIEDSTKSFDVVSRRFLSEVEVSSMTKDDIALAWSIKEAAYKMIGRQDIVFNKMFVIEEINRDKGEAIMLYNNTNYRLLFFQHGIINVSFCALNFN